MPAERIAIAAMMTLLAGSAFVARRATAAARIGLYLVAAALTAMLVQRWIASGHPPVFGTFEQDLVQTLLLLALVPLLQRRMDEPYVRAPAIVALLTLAHTFTLRHEITPLTISEISLWIDLHAVLAWVAWACYLHAACLSWREQHDGLALRLMGVGFAAHSAMAFTGIYYASVLFASPWDWDPVQTLGLLCWVVYGIVLHFRLFYGLTLRRQRYLVLVALIVFVLSAKAIMLFPGGMSFHVFELGSMAQGR